MSFSNRIFNVNGQTDEMLGKALELVFMQSRFDAESWQETTENGLILSWHHEDTNNRLPTRMDATDCLPLVQKWLKSDFAKTVTPGNGCQKVDHDGSTSTGWQVYCDRWGHVGHHHYAICGIRPAFILHGK